VAVLPQLIFAVWNNQVMFREYEKQQRVGSFGKIQCYSEE
jgi:hypothetical protein